MSDKTDKTQTIITNMNRTDMSIVPRLCENRQRKILTIRSFSGLSGDMLCCGLGYAWLEEQNLQPSSAEGDKAINDMAGAIMPVLAGTIGIKRKLVNGIGGCHLRVDFASCPRTPHAWRHQRYNNTQFT